MASHAITFPPFHKVRSLPVNPRLYEHAKKEFERLTGYMYRHSTSPWASPLVIAPKATKPFIRFCGDYRWLNAYVLKTQAYIPRVQYEVEKAMGFKIFLDIDMTKFFSPVPSDRAIESAPGNSVALGSGGTDLFALSLIHI